MSQFNKLRNQIPASLRSIDRWVLRDEKKAPRQTNGWYASSVAPSTWCTHAEAVDALEANPGKFAGIGLVVCDDDDVVGIDLDKIDQDADRSQRAEEIQKRFSTTYQERSPSGRGVRIWVRGRLPWDGSKNDKCGIEVYQSKRYLTATGDHLEGSALEVAECQEAVDWLVATYFADHQVRTGNVRRYESDLNDDLADDIRRHLSKRPGTTEGQNASGACFKVACDIVHGFELSADDLLPFMAEWGERPDQQFKDGKYNPWSEAEIVHKLRDAARKPSTHQDGSGWLRDGAYLAKYEPQIAAAIKGWPGQEQHQEQVEDEPEQHQGSVEDDIPFDPSKYKKPKIRLQRWSELKRIAAAQEDKWIIRDILEPGTLVVFSGLPYSGKTTILAHLMGCVATGRSWLGKEVCERCPILFANCDRLRERIVVKRVARGLADEFEEAEFEERFFNVPVEDLPQTLTPEYIAELVEAVKEAIGEAGGNTGIVIIDPLRAAFMQDCEAGGENDPTTMTRILSPLRKLSRTTNWTIIVPHHNNKGRDQYSGTAAIPGNTDGMWSVSREERATISKLSITTRDGLMPMMEVSEGPEGLSLVNKSYAEKKDERAALVEQIRKFPGMAPGLTREEAMKLVGMTSETSFRRWLEGAEEAGMNPRLERMGKGSKSSPYTYFRSGE